MDWSPRIVGGSPGRAVMRAHGLSVPAYRIGGAVGPLPTHFVHAAFGDDARTKAQAANPATPWASIYRACRGAPPGSADDASEAASAGNVVSIAPGVYQAAAQTETNFYLALSPINSGTAGSPIRFQSTNNQYAAIRVTRSNPTVTGGSIIGSVDKDYIEWSGYDLNETDWPWDEAALPSSSDFESGKCLFYASSGVLTGCKIENSKLTGTVTSTRQGDNYTLVRLHRVEDCTIRNVRFADVGANDDNNAGTLWYYASRVTVENCWFGTCGVGIYIKADAPPPASTGGHIIRNNWFENTNLAAGITVFRDAIGSESSPNLIYQNIFKGAEHSVRFIAPFGDATDAKWVRFVNNVFYEPTGWAVELQGAIVDNGSDLFQNNIFVRAGQTIYGSDSTGPVTLETDRLLAVRNLYNASTANFADFAGFITFANWQSTYSQDADGTTTTSQIFVNAGTDFHLSGSSPALNLGRVVHSIGGTNGDTIHAGAYITGSETIGLLQ